MQIQGVITGDIIDSTQIEINMRAELLSVIKDTVADIGKYINSKVEVEIYRGDSFQILISNPIEALRVAILVRLGIQYRTPQIEKNRSKNKWDARISLGIGDITFHSNSIVESDGEAYRNSGREFDQLGKNDRFAIRTPWEELNEELKVSSKFADIMINGWNNSQIEVNYHYLLEQISQKELARKIFLSPQALSKRIIGSKVEAIELFIQRYERIIKKKIEDGID